MCGIVAYVGNKQCKNILINGLKRLEYRGYDSAGIGILTGSNGNKSIKPGGNTANLQIKIVKEAGKIKMLEELLNNIEVGGVCGIGHTRWATHGEPTQINAHPHLDCENKIAVVHNGIIENYGQLKEDLAKRGHIFLSQTDTEVLPHLLEEYLKSGSEGNLQLAMQKLLKVIRGSGAIVALSADHPDELVAGRISSPLIVGVSRAQKKVDMKISCLRKYLNNLMALKKPCEAGY